MLDLFRFEKHEKDGIETERFAEMLLVSGTVLFVNKYSKKFAVLVLNTVTVMAIKNYYFFKRFFASYFSKLHLHHFLKIKSHKEVTKQ